LTSRGIQREHLFAIFTSERARAGTPIERPTAELFERRGLHSSVFFGTAKEVDGLIARDWLGKSVAPEDGWS
jgi:hypothetical protein